MRIYLVKLQYQGDDRVEDEYLVYSECTDEDKIVDMVIDLPEFEMLEADCIVNWAEEDDDPDEQYASVIAIDITEDVENGNWSLDSSWFKNLPILIDESNNNN